MQIRNLIYVACWTFFFSCAHPTTNNGWKKVVIRNTFTIEMPGNFTVKENDGVDSYFFQIGDSSSFALKGDFGSYKNSVIDLPIVIFDMKNKDSLLKMNGGNINTSIVFFSETPEEDRRQNIFSKQFYLYDTIHGIVGKIVQPKRIGDGITALYIPKLKDDQSLTLYANNLDSNKQRLALKIFETIKLIQ